MNKRKDGLYQVRATINGKRRSFYGKTQKEAKEKRDKEKMNENMGIIQSDIKCLELAQNWINNKRLSCRHNTINMYLNCLNKHIIDDIGHIEVRKIKKDNINKCQKKNLSKSSNKKIIQTLKQLFEYAIENDIIIKNPANNMKVIGKDAKKVNYIEDEKIKRIFEETKEKRGYLFFAIAYYTGLRAGEIRALKWRDIKNGYITVNKQMVYIKNKETKITETKTKNGIRQVPIPTKLKEIFDQIKEKDEEKNIILCADGRPITYDSYRRLIEPLKKYNVTPHQFRHTYCTKLAENNIDLKTASYLMGHADIKTTANIYQDVSKRKLESTKDKIKDIF